jgi:hypothetical protein
MKRLNGVDAFMLGMETAKSYMHTFKVAIIDPSTDPGGADCVVTKWLESFNEFPPRAKAASFTIDQVVEKLMPRT